MEADSGTGTGRSMGRENAAAAMEKRQLVEPTVIDAGVLLNRSWWLYSDGTLQGETVDGMQRFRDFQHFKSFVESSPAVRIGQSSNEPSEELSVSSGEPIATSGASAAMGEIEKDRAAKPLIPRLFARLLSGFVALVIWFLGWSVLSEAIKLDEARKVERETRLQQANTLEHLKSPEEVKDGDDTIAVVDDLHSVTVSGWNWRLEGYVAIMFASFTLQNQNPFAVQDVEITCDIVDNTGALVDWNIMTVHDIINGSSSKAFENFSMGFVYYQGTFSVPIPITSINCRISNFARASNRARKLGN